MVWDGRSRDFVAWQVYLGGIFFLPEVHSAADASPPVTPPLPYAANRKRKTGPFPVMPWLKHVSRKRPSWMTHAALGGIKIPRERCGVRWSFAITLDRRGSEVLRGTTVSQRGASHGTSVNTALWARGGASWIVTRAEPNRKSVQISSTYK